MLSPDYTVFEFLRHELESGSSESPLIRTGGGAADSAYYYLELNDSLCGLGMRPPHGYFLGHQTDTFQTEHFVL